MKPFILIRKYEKSDNLSCQEVVKDFIMSGVFDAFLNLLFREITLQLIVITWAFLFIFVGFPLYICVLAAPGVIVFMLFSVYTAFFTSATELASDNEKCWVAEVYEPFIQQFDKKDIEYNFITADSLSAFDLEINKMKRSIVGTVSVKSHLSLHCSGWIYRLAVHPKYPFESIAEHLLANVLQHAKCEKWYSLESVTTECQWQIRDLYSKMGFIMRLIYHKPVAGSSIRIMKSQMGYDLVENGSDRDKLH